MRRGETTAPLGGKRHAETYQRRFPGTSPGRSSERARLRIRDGLRHPENRHAGERGELDREISRSEAGQILRGDTEEHRTTPAAQFRSGRPRGLKDSARQDARAFLSPVRGCNRVFAMMGRQTFQEIKSSPGRCDGQTRAARYHGYFAEALTRLHGERRYRVFADLERKAGRFPYALWHSPH